MKTASRFTLEQWRRMNAHRRRDTAVELALLDQYAAKQSRRVREWLASAVVVLTAATITVWGFGVVVSSLAMGAGR